MAGQTTGWTSGGQALRGWGDKQQGVQASQLLGGAGVMRATGEGDRGHGPGDKRRVRLLDCSATCPSVAVCLLAAAFSTGAEVEEGRAI